MTAATSLQLTVAWTTVEMSTGFSTRKMWRGAARSSSSTVPRTTVQRSTLRSSQSTVPRTTARTSTLSAEQQLLRKVAACLPMWYLYGTCMETSTQFTYFIREWRHCGRNTSRRTTHHWRSIRRQSIIVFIPARSAFIDMQTKCSACNWAVTPKTKLCLYMLTASTSPFSISKIA